MCGGACLLLPAAIGVRLHGDADKPACDAGGELMPPGHGVAAVDLENFAAVEVAFEVEVRANRRMAALADLNPRSHLEEVVRPEIWRG